MADGRERTGEQVLEPLPAGAGDELSRLSTGRRGRERESFAIGAFPAGGGRGGFRAAVGKAAGDCRSGGRGAGGVPAAGAVAPGAVGEPRDLAELLASHARDALARVEAAEVESVAGAAPPGDLGASREWLPGRPSPQPSPTGRGSKSRRAVEDAEDMQRSPLGAVREALEEALGVQFRGKRGARFFRSTLVQTLFTVSFRRGCCGRVRRRRRRACSTGERPCGT